MQDDWMFQLSLKFGPNNDGMLNVRGITTEHFVDNIRGLRTAIAEAVAATQELSAMGTVVHSFPDAQVHAQTTVATPAAAIPATAAAPTFAGPNCLHGAMVRRTGVSARGSWGAWFCPTPKGTVGQCQAIFD